MSVLYSATVVCPMVGLPVAHGGVAVSEGRIVAVGRRRDLRPEADREHHVQGVIVPGLVNAATQLEHADAAELAGSGPFHLWLQALLGLTQGWDEQAWRHSARRGVHRLLRAGVTCVGDAVTRGPAVPAAVRAGLVGTSWVDVAFVDVAEHDAVVAAVDHSLERPAPGRHVGIGLAPVTLGTGVTQALAALASRRDAPLLLRAAFSQAEVSALLHGGGPLAQLARSRGLDAEWLDGGTGLTPVRYLAACGALTSRAALAHGVFVDDEEARLLAAHAVPVVCCPRADARLRAGDAPLDRYAREGVGLALGTASPAANPDLDVLGEAGAWVHLARRRGLRTWPGDITLEEQAVRLATVDGAAAMGWGDRAGILAPGRRADLAGLRLETDAANVYRELVERGPGRQVLCVAGGVARARRDDADEAWTRPEEA